MQRFTCGCGNVLFFGSVRCLSCDTEVGFDPRRREMRRLSPAGKFKPCANGALHGVCNWLLEADSPETLCEACRMNRVVPDLGWKRNQLLWGKVETAKRRLLYTLSRLGIALPSKAEDAKMGMAFEIVSTVLNPAVTTGHLNGVITVNLEEADDTYRQINRQQLGENSRTLLGHFRHESGHYCWERFLSGLEWGDPARVAFREIFGNEWLEYGSALAAYYRDGAPPGWQGHFISAYASSHPWEDWAETWAHYLQMVDGLETCGAMGIEAGNLALPPAISPAAAGALPQALPQSPEEDGAFLAMLQRWTRLSTALNEVSDTLGEAPLCPFVISSPIARKLRLAHYLASLWGAKETEFAVASSPAGLSTEA